MIHKYSTLIVEIYKKYEFTSKFKIRIKSDAYLIVDLKNKKIKKLVSYAF